MTLSSWIAALALMGADEPQNPRQPIIPGSPIPAMMRCEKSGGACPWVDEIRASVLQTGPVDASTLAACAAAAQSGCVLKAVSTWDDVRNHMGTPKPAMPKVAKPRTTNDPEPREIWKLSLPDATRIALKNCEIVRVVSSGEKCETACGSEPTALKTGAKAGTDSHDAPIVIARGDTEAGTWRFKAEVMAMVRSVEQQYWNLAQAHVQLWCADRAVALAQEVLQRERAKLATGHGTIADIAEVEQRLAQFQLDLITRTSDVITTERQLRNLLGLAPADGRRIVPTTAVTEARVEPDWDSCLAEMRRSQPDILQQKAIVRLAEVQLLMARNQLLPVLGMDSLHQFKDLGLPMDSAEKVVLAKTLRALESWVANPEKATASFESLATNKDWTSWAIGGTIWLPPFGRPLANTRQAQYILLRSRAYLQQVEHQTTHSLARFFLEIDANYKQFQTAERLRQAAAQRLDAQRAYYEEGRITIDRFLDAITQYATAVATEAQYKTTYNISLAALEEAKGTLLERKSIIVAELADPHPASPQPAKPAKHDLAAARPDSQVVTASMKNLEQPKPAEPTKATAATTAPASSKTWTFSISIGRKKPLKIKGTITSTESAPASPAK